MVVHLIFGRTPVRKRQQDGLVVLVIAAGIVVINLIIYQYLFPSIGTLAKTCFILQGIFVAGIAPRLTLSCLDVRQNHRRFPG